MMGKDYILYKDGLLVYDIVMSPAFSSGVITNNIIISNKRNRRKVRINKLRYPGNLVV